jgi:hypothetical protein
MDEEKSRRVQALIGMFAVHAPLSAVAQKAVIRECEAGHFMEITEALAHALLQQGISSGKIPANAGKKDIDATKACIDVVESYANQGGALYARGWISRWALSAILIRKWNADFAPEIPVSKKLILGLPEQELADRVCVAVLSCRDRYLELTEGEDPVVRMAQNATGYNYLVSKEDLETVLSALVKAALNAFDDPNAANHRLLHGPKV